MSATLKFIIGSLLAVIAFRPASVAAQEITSISIDPFPVVVGHIYKYTANNDGFAGGPFNHWWEYQCTQDGPHESWAVTAFGERDIYFTEPRVGNQAIRVSGWFQMGAMNPPIYSDFRQRDFSVVGPDEDEVIYGLGVDSSDGTAGPMMPPNVMELEVKFEVRRGQTKIGFHTAGAAQERIRRPQYQFDSGWASGEAGVYWLDNGVIRDKKTVDVSASQQAWDNLAINAEFDDFYQQNRVWIWDCRETSEKQYYYYLGAKLRHICDAA